MNDKVITFINIRGVKWKVFSSNGDVYAKPESGISYKTNICDKGNYYTYYGTEALTEESIPAYVRRELQKQGIEGA